jgi:transaldolase
LLSKEGNDPLEQLRQITEIVCGPVSAQVTQTEPEDMVRQGLALSKVAENVIIKVPATKNGLLAARGLTDKGVNCNITLTFHPCQSLPFLKIPVAYVSLIVGRIEDFGLDTTGRVEEMRVLIDRMGVDTKLLVASLRDPGQLLEAVGMGADVVTVPPATWDTVYSNPITAAGAADFMNMWHSLPNTVREAYENSDRSNSHVVERQSRSSDGV